MARVEILRVDGSREESHVSARGAVLMNWVRNKMTKRKETFTAEAVYLGDGLWARKGSQGTVRVFRDRNPISQLVMTSTSIYALYALGRRAGSKATKKTKKNAPQPPPPGTNPADVVKT